MWGEAEVRGNKSELRAYLSEKKVNIDHLKSVNQEYKATCLAM